MCLWESAYIGKFFPWSYEQINIQQKPINEFLRQISQHPPTFPTKLLYLPTYPGGMGFDCLKDIINKAK
jgi:hypothetical protein